MITSLTLNDIPDICIENYCELKINFNNDGKKMYDCLIFIADINNKFFNQIIKYLIDKTNVKFDICYQYYYTQVKEKNFNHIYKNNDENICESEIYDSYEYFMINQISKKYNIDYNNIRCSGYK
jgi:hypothetical protein